MPSPSKYRYTLSFLSIAVSFFLTLLLNRVISPPLPFPFFFLAVALSAWFGGMRPAILAISLSLILSTYFFIPPYRTFHLDANTIIQLIVFLFVSLVISYSAETKRRSETKLRTILASIGDGVVVADSTGRIQFMNQVAEDITGYTNKEAEGHFFGEIFKLYSEETSSKIQDPVEKVIQEGVIVGLGNHTFIIRKDGSHIPLDDSAAPILDENRRLLGAILVFRDITQRKANERELADREGRYRAIFDQIAIGVGELNLDAQYVMVNDKYCEITGYSREQLLQLHMIDVTHPEDLEVSKRAFETAVSTGKVVEMEKRFIRKDGSFSWAHKSFSRILDSSGKTVRALSVIVDLTEKKLVEEQLRTSLAEKEALLQEIHHRVKNNLQVVTSLLSLQEKRMDDPVLRSVLKESEDRIRAMALVHQQLYTQSNELASIEFSEYLKSLSKGLMASHAPHGTKIHTHIKSDIFIPITVAVPLGLIANELISNALKYAFVGREAGEISVRAETIRESHLMLLSVSDNGVGLPADFEPGRTRTLGLKLVHLLSEQIKGEMDYSSSSQGTEFRLRIPKYS